MKGMEERKGAQVLVSALENTVYLSACPFHR